MEISKSLLDRYYGDFDIERFKAVDPCGVVYKLIEHLDNEDSRTVDIYSGTICNRQLDIELGGLFVAMISWGSRKVIYPTALRMIGEEMCWHPSRFILNREYLDSYKKAKNDCVYRTLNVHTFKSVCDNVYNALSSISLHPLTLESYFAGQSTKSVISTLCKWLSPAKVGTMDNSACKRMCMYVRWMTRRDSPDLGIWLSRSCSDLYAVLDVHVCDLTRELLGGRRPSWQTCVALTDIFKSWDPIDPLKYDVALMTLSDRLESKS